MLESTLQSKILLWLQGIPFLYVIKTIYCNKKGIPDLIICYKGYFIFIEIKSPGSKATQLQRYTQGQLLSCGALGFITSSLPHCQLELMKILNTLDNLSSSCYTK